GNWKGNQVTIQHSLSSAAAGSLDASATFRISSANFKLYNVNIRNNYGQGAQAVAVSARGDKQGYYGCAFYSYQDTLYVYSNKPYYSNCYIEGAVDYIFGGASVWFGECTIASNGGGAITASSREVATDSGWYVIDSSTLKSNTLRVTAAANSGDLTAKVYLGRPWRVLARVIYQNSALSAIIAPKGWTEMAAGATPLYYEYENTGAGASTSQRQYLSSISAPMDKTTLFGSNWTSWIDRSY
ncbi:carbohydrate esterase family 8 protein, partial [Cadophora sp. DSE1049]